MRNCYRVLAATLAILALVLLGPSPSTPVADGIPLPVRMAAQTSVLTGYLSDNIKITKVQDHTTAGTSTISATGVDMANYTGVVFLTSYGTAASDNTCHLEQSTDDVTYDDLASTEAGVASSDEDVFLDIRNPRERYVRMACLRGTSSTLESVWAFQYGGRSLPADNTTAGTIHGETHNSPAEGSK